MPLQPTLLDRLLSPKPQFVAAAWPPGYSLNYLQRLGTTWILLFIGRSAWQKQGKLHYALAAFLQDDVTAVGAGDFPRDAQAEACPLGLMAVGWIATVEAIE